MFRYNDPQEAARLRKEGNKTHLNLSRLSFLSRSATDLIRSCDNISGLVTLSYRYSQKWALNLFFCATNTTTTQLKNCTITILETLCSKYTCKCNPITIIPKNLLYLLIKQNLIDRNYPSISYSNQILYSVMPIWLCKIIDLLSCPFRYQVLYPTIAYIYFQLFPLIHPVKFIHNPLHYLFIFCQRHCIVY